MSDFLDYVNKQAQPAQEQESERQEKTTNERQRNTKLSRYMKKLEILEIELDELRRKLKKKEAAYAKVKAEIKALLG